MPIPKYTYAQRVTAFWSKVDRNGPIPEYASYLGPCWLWTASLNNMGYGKFWDGQRLVLAHVWAYRQVFGETPSGSVQDHLCRTARCVRPCHQEPVSHRENILRGAALKTHCPSGHAYDGDNLRVEQNGHRRCRTCCRERDLERRPSRQRLVLRAAACALAQANWS